jgi:hypothetical protein
MVRLADQGVVRVILDNGFIENALDYLISGRDYALILRAFVSLLEFVGDPELAVFERMCDAGVFDQCEELVQNEQGPGADIARSLLMTAEQLHADRSC